jgi:hypothetical protein
MGQRERERGKILVNSHNKADKTGWKNVENEFALIPNQPSIFPTATS